jgi:RNA polymerase sigma-70 factor (ECF subfamily)
MDNSSNSSILKCAAGQWIDAHGDYLYGYALLRVGDPKIAEALLRRTLTAGLAQLDTVQEKVSERAWLISILRHEIIEHFKTVNRQRRIEPFFLGDICLQKYFSTSGKWLEKPTPGTTAPSKASHPKTFAHAFYICLKDIPSALRHI